MGKIVWVGVILLAARLALAQAPADGPVTPTTPSEFEVARQQAELGTQAYERGHYDVALKHFQAASAAAPSPEIQFKIGRCLERLGRWDMAAQAYERYLAGNPAVSDAAEIRERISDLHLRALEATRLSQPPPAVAMPAPPRRSLRIPALVLLIATPVLAGAATGAYLSEWSDYETRRDACQGRCSPESLEALRSRVQLAQVAGGVLYAVAGVVLIADIVLWIVDAKQHRSPRHALRDGLTVRF